MTTAATTVNGSHWTEESLGAFGLGFAGTASTGRGALGPGGVSFVVVDNPGTSSGGTGQLEASRRRHTIPMKCSYHPGYQIPRPAVQPDGLPFPMGKVRLLKERLLAEGVL